MEKVGSKERASHSSHDGVLDMSQHWTVAVADLNLVYSGPVMRSDRVSYTAVERGLWPALLCCCSSAL